MDMPKPTPGHAKLEKLDGRWEGEETMSPSQWDPKGGVATGRSNGRVALDGFALVTEYEQERAGAITFSGHGVMTFNPQTSRYGSAWKTLFDGRYTRR